MQLPNKSKDDQCLNELSQMLSPPKSSSGAPLTSSNNRLKKRGTKVYDGAVLERLRKDN